MPPMTSCDFNKSQVNTIETFKMSLERKMRATLDFIEEDLFLSANAC